MKKGDNFEDGTRNMKGWNIEVKINFVNTKIIFKLKKHNFDLIGKKGQKVQINNFTFVHLFVSSRPEFSTFWGSLYPLRLKNYFVAP